MSAGAFASSAHFLACFAKLTEPPCTMGSRHVLVLLRVRAYLNVAAWNLFRGPASSLFWVPWRNAPDKALDSLAPCRSCRLLPRLFT